MARPVASADAAAQPPAQLDAMTAAASRGGRPPGEAPAAIASAPPLTPGALLGQTLAFDHPGSPARTLQLLAIYPVACALAAIVSLRTPAVEGWTGT